MFSLISRVSCHPSGERARKPICAASFSSLSLSDSALVARRWSFSASVIIFWIDSSRSAIVESSSAAPASFLSLTTATISLAVVGSFAPRTVFARGSSAGVLCAAANIGVSETDTLDGSHPQLTRPSEAVAAAATISSRCDSAVGLDAAATLSTIALKPHDPT